MNDLSVNELRSEFDLAFSEPPQAVADRRHEFLLVSAAHDHYALRPAQVLHVLRKPNIRAVPMRHPAGVGLLANRGQAYTALSLSRLLGLDPEDDESVALITPGGIALLVSGLRHVEAPAGQSPTSLAVDQRVYRVLDMSQLLESLDAEAVEASSE